MTDPGIGAGDEARRIEAVLRFHADQGRFHRAAARLAQ